MQGARTPARVGIAGYGVVGRLRHAVMNTRSDMNVVAVCDQRYAREEILENGVRAWTNYHDLLNEDLDVVFVCVPNYLAPEVTIAALSGGRHVFCEKPPGRDLDDIARVIACEQAHPGLKLMYGFNHRYHDSVQDALRLIRSGELGRLINLRGVYGKSQMIRFDTDWRTQRAMSGGGILLDQGIHMVDMMRLFAGDFVDVHSFVSNSYWHHDVEDNAYALMRTTDGVVAMLNSSATQWRHRFQLEIALEKGAIILSGILSSTKSYGAETITVVRRGDDDRGDPMETTTRYNRDHSWEDEIDAFARAIAGDAKIVDGSSAEAMATMALVYRIYCADPAWQKQFGLSDTTR
jgi:predicted dehydrogenase